MPRRRRSPPQIVEHYADQREAEGAPPNSVRNLRAAARRLRRAGLRDATRAAVLQVRDHLVTEGGLSPTTVQGYLDCASAAWGWAQERGLVAGSWPRVRKLPRRDTRKRPYTLEEADAVVTWFACHRPWLYPFVLLLWETGARSGEVRAMLGEDVDRQRGRVVLRHTKSGEVRVVPVRAETLAALPRRRGHEHLWVGPRAGRPLAHSSVMAALGRCFSDLGLPGEELDLHSFRRAWVQDALRAGVSLPDSMATLGHTDLRVHVRYQRNALKDPERLRKRTSAIHDYRNGLPGKGLGPAGTCGAGSRPASDESQCLGAQGRATRTSAVNANRAAILHAARSGAKRAAVRMPGCRGFLLHAYPEVYSILVGEPMR